MTNPAVSHDKLVSQQFAVHSGSPHDDESSPNPSLGIYYISKLHCVDASDGHSGYKSSFEACFMDAL